MINELQRAIARETWEDCTNFEGERVEGIYNDGSRVSVPLSTLVKGDKLYVNLSENPLVDEIKKYIEKKYGVFVEKMDFIGTFVLEISFYP